MTSLESIERDLRPFADPATDLALARSNTIARLQMIRDGIQHDYFINIDSGQITARHDSNRRFIDLSSLLASPGFADLKSMADTQKRLHRDTDLSTRIPPEGRLDHGTLTTDRLRSAITPGDKESANLRILLLDGPAGVGKLPY